MRRYHDEPIAPGRRYRERQGAYAVILEGSDVLVTYEEGEREFQLPGGGLDAGEGALRALQRECVEETGWRIRVLRRLGAFQRYVYMPNYGMWAHKVCHIYLARPVRRIGPPTEAGHAAIWMPVATALTKLSVEGDRAFLARAAQARGGLAA
jgi:8-oxo-dGTP diphosphatase